MSWLLVVAAIVVLLILRKVMTAFARLVVDLLLILAGLIFLLVVLPSNILNQVYSLLPKGLAQIIKGFLPALREGLPVPY